LDFGKNITRETLSNPWVGGKSKEVISFKNLYSFLEGLLFSYRACAGSYQTSHASLAGILFFGPKSLHAKSLLVSAHLGNAHRVNWPLTHDLTSKARPRG